MHEMSIALQIIDHALEAARRHDATRIEEVEVEVGAMRQVVPEALEFAFSVATEGTLAEGARLRVTQEKVLAACNLCQCTFAPDIDRSFACPQCQKADVRIIAGNDILLKTVVCHTDEGVSA